MNLAVRLTALRDYVPTTYADGSYIMQPSDFIGGCAIKTDAVSGRQFGIGKTVLGDNRVIPLGVPICVSCDGPISDDLCVACELEFVR